MYLLGGGTTKPTRGTSAKMPCFEKNNRVAVNFTRWITSLGGGGKGKEQARQIVTRILKFLKFACSDQDSSWDVPDGVLDFALGTVTIISDFVEYIQEAPWKIGQSGIIGYMNALLHMLDFRRAHNSSKDNVSGNLN